jgi:predicted nucleotidyltransferase
MPGYSPSVPSLAAATLSPAERLVLDRFLSLLEHEFGPELHAVWLYGSRARGERPHDHSDVDLLVVTTKGDFDDLGRVITLLHRAAFDEGANPAVFSAQVYSPERLTQRREIESFFIQEVDRDKIVLAGEG